MTRHKNIKSPFAERRRSSFNKPRLTERAGARDAVVPEQVAAFEQMCAARPLKPPPTNFGPCRSHAASTDARKARG